MDLERTMSSRRFEQLQARCKQRTNDPVLSPKREDTGMNTE